MHKVPKDAFAPGTYQARALALLMTQPPGSMMCVNIQHDDNCERLKGGECNCDPDIKLIEGHDAKS